MSIYNSFNELVAANTVDSPLQNPGITDNMVGISYANPEVEAQCTPGTAVNKKLSEENQKVLAKQLKRLEDAITLEELKGNKELIGKRDKKGNFHSLKQDRAGQLAGALHGGERLIFTPKHDPAPLDSNGNLDWSKVTEVEIQEIFDYHK